MILLSGGGKPSPRTPSSPSSLPAQSYPTRASPPSAAWRGGSGTHWTPWAPCSAASWRPATSVTTAAQASRSLQVSRWPSCAFSTRPNPDALCPFPQFDFVSGCPVDVPDSGEALAFFSGASTEQGVRPSTAGLQRCSSGDRACLEPHIGPQGLRVKSQELALTTSGHGWRKGVPRAKPFIWSESLSELK